jgi:hypothetical protein
MCILVKISEGEPFATSLKLGDKNYHFFLSCYDVFSRYLVVVLFDSQGEFSLSTNPAGMYLMLVEALTKLSLSLSTIEISLVRSLYVT